MSLVWHSWFSCWYQDEGLGLHLNREKLAVNCTLLIICLIPPLLAFERIHFYRLPVGGDTGIYLRWSYPIFEKNLIWKENPLQYPPLLGFIIYPTAKVIGEIWTMTTIGLYLLGLRPLTIFVFMNKLFKTPFFVLL